MFSFLGHGLAIDQVIYAMGALDPFIPPTGPSEFDFVLEFDLTICRSSILGICDSFLVDSVNSDNNLHHYMEYNQFTSPN